MKQETTIYVSPEGSSFNSGSSPDAPKHFHELPRLMGYSDLEAPSTNDICIILRGGTYELQEPIILKAGPSHRVTLKAFPNEAPVLSGARTLSGFQETQHQGRRAWIMHCPEVASGLWSFKDLFVNGEARSRPRLPKQGKLQMEHVPDTDLSKAYWRELYNGQKTFQYREGDIDPHWINPENIDVLVPHLWIQERMPISKILAESRTVVSEYSSVFKLREDHKANYDQYILENVYEALSEPGEFYLCDKTGTLTYLPLDGEKLEHCRIEAPHLSNIIETRGDACTGAYVENLSFEGITFRGTQWDMNGRVRDDVPGFPHQRPTKWAASPQAAAEVGGALQLDACKNISFQSCTVEMTGAYGIAIEKGSKHIDILDCELKQLGAGAIKIDGAKSGEAQALRCGYITVDHCHIHHGGRVFPSGVGILITHGHDNRLSNNHIHDLCYSGISSGWVWGYTDSVTRDNLIENNHIHSIGQGHISDMGGVYLLGCQPGTIVRGNHIHHVRARTYGGWGVYLDEGAGHILVEDNLIHHCSSTGALSKGRANIFRRNIFALCDEGGFSVMNQVDSSIPRIVFQHNILIVEGTPMFMGPNEKALEAHLYMSDLNILFDRQSSAPIVGERGKDEFGNLIYHSQMSWDKWIAAGLDCNSILEDPMFTDPDGGDFSLQASSPVLKIIKGYQTHSHA